MFKILQWHTDQSHPSASIIRDKKGSAVLIFALLITIILLLANIAYVNYRVLLAKRDMVDDAITTSALATLNVIDPVQMAYGKIQFDNQAVEDWQSYSNPFLSYLEKNLNLDQNLNPIDNKSIIKYININDVKVYYPGDTMYNGLIAAKPSIYVSMDVVVTNILNKNVTLNVQKIVDIDYQLNTNIN
ncbi:hypothetical protein [Thermoanaerobacterium sp. RBIITD]|uniref:hypothetical protein n=1 Tax=Thermoanaerobacterium sp. RBIITD TaxID=1550240 RepID=UPI000BB7C423|nr:hypothetical protein [Thermoanaerobacterium sp. RBIITD]